MCGEKETGMKTRVSILIAIFFSCVVHGAEPAMLTEYKVKQSQLIAEITSEFELTKKDALSGYGKAIRSRMDYLKRQGKLDAYLALENESKRFTSDGTVLPADTPGLNALVVETIKAYENALLQAEESRNSRMAAMQSQYVTALQRLIRTLMQQDDIAGAKVVQDELKSAQLGVPAVETKGVVARTFSPSDSLRKGLVLHYGFDTDEGNVVTDKSAAKLNGKVYGAKWVADGPAGGRYEFDGKDYGIASDGMLPSCAEGTISMLVKHGSAEGNPIFFRVGKNGVSGCGFSLSLHGSGNGPFKVQHDARKYGGRLSPTYAHPLPVDQWAHIVVTATKRGAGVFIDGKRAKVRGLGITDFTRIISEDADQVLIGKFQGSIDEVMVWDRPLSDGEIESLCNTIRGQ
jgi:hypothetical protein